MRPRLRSLRTPPRGLITALVCAVRGCAGRACAVVACAVVGVMGATAAVAAPGAAAAAVAASGASGTVPVSAMNGWSLHGLSSPDLDAQLALMQSEGVTLLRVDASWSAIEPSVPGPSGPAYNFWAMDAEVGDMASHDIRWLPIIDYSAPWAGSVRGDWRSAPASDTQYAAFAAAIAARYGPGGSFWAQHPQLPYEPVQTYEIWNEENANYFWDNGPDPGAYAALYLAARAAIRAVDPQAQVSVGGLTNPRQGISALAFLNGMFQAVPGLVGNVDAVAIHPYAANASGTVQFVVAVRQLLDSVGESAVPIEVTEFGWQTGSAAVEQQRAANMSAVARALGNSNCGIGMLAPYDWMDPSYITSGDWGLAGSNGVRPAGTAWFTGLANAAGGGVNQLCPAVSAPAGGTTASGPATVGAVSAPAGGTTASGPATVGAAADAPDGGGPAHVATTLSAPPTGIRPAPGTARPRPKPQHKATRRPRSKSKAKAKRTARARAHRPTARAHRRHHH